MLNVRLITLIDIVSQLNIARYFAGLTRLRGYPTFLLFPFLHCPK